MAAAEQRIGELVDDVLAKLLPPPLDDEYLRIVANYRETHDEITRRAFAAWHEEVRRRIEQLTFFGEVSEEVARAQAVRDAADFKEALDREVTERLTKEHETFQRKLHRLWEQAQDER